MVEINQHIFLVGFMGCGKTTLSGILAESNKMPLIDTDKYIEEKTGSTIANIFSEEGEDKFRALETETLKEIVKLSPSVISTGGGMPCFGENMDIMNSNGITVYLKANPEILTEILFGNKERPLVKGKTKEELFQYISKTLEYREQYYNNAKLSIEALTTPPEQIAEKLNAMLK